MTALVIVISGSYLELQGAALTTQAFSTGLRGLGLGDAGRHVVTLGTVLFALSTSISWSYYGDRCIEYLLPQKRVVTAYRALFCVFLFIGAIWKLKLVWSFVDMVITFMALPNLIALILLRKEIVQTTKRYFSKNHVPARQRAAN
jgi:AGCS family alanine or glycine:cation symporter